MKRNLALAGIVVVALLAVAAAAGTPAANNAARADGWPKLIAFLRAQLAG